MRCNVAPLQQVAWGPEQSLGFNTVRSIRFRLILDLGSDLFGLYFECLAYQKHRVIG